LEYGGAQAERRGAGVKRVNANDSNARLQTRLERGRRRVEAATLGGPEWDAAMAHTDARQHQIDALKPLPSVEGGHIVSRLGPIALEDGCLVHGRIAACGLDGEALRLEISDIPDRVRSVDEFSRELEILARRAEFILEIDGSKADLNFYAWDPELPRPKARPRESRAMSSNG
jgi:hypothetical protein